MPSSTFQNFTRPELEAFLYQANFKKTEKTECKHDYTRYKDDPVGFCKEILGVSLWSKQREILRALASEPRVSVRSCHGAGKTFVAACGTIWFVQTRPGSVAITTAPTGRQVKDLLWRRINAAFHNALLPMNGRCLTTTMDCGYEWYASGYATDEQISFQGPHSPKGVLFVGDEASGLAEWVFPAVQGFMTQEGAKMLLIGNPNHAHGYFYESQRKWPKKQRFKISAFDVPPRVLRPDWRDEMLLDYGLDSPTYAIRVLGDFPAQSESALFSLSDVEAAQDRRFDFVPEDGFCLGADIARYGTDESVAYVRNGDKVVHAEYWRGHDTMQSAGRIAELCKHFWPRTINVDEIGLGAGVVDKLAEDGWPVSGVNVGVPARSKSQEYENLRIELYMELAARFKAGTVSIPLDDQKLVDQLTSLTYSYTSKGKRKLISKEDMRKTGLKSPDRADALMLCYADDVGGWVAGAEVGAARSGWR